MQRVRGIKNPVAAFAAMMTLMNVAINESSTCSRNWKSRRYFGHFTSDNGPLREGDTNRTSLTATARSRLARSYEEGSGGDHCLVAGENQAGFEQRRCGGVGSFATLCELAGMDKPKGIDGVSSLRLARPTKKQERGSISIGNFTSGEASRPSAWASGRASA